MIEEVWPNIFRTEIPLPANPLKAINSYVVKGGDKFLIIDTGMNRPECLEAMQSSLKKLGVDMQQTDFFITHVHADHFGLVSELVNNSSKIYFNHPDAEIIRDPHHWEKLATSAALNGFPTADLRAAIKKHPGHRYHARGPVDLCPLKEGDVIPIGDYAFRCVETPGHTKGHMCLYDPNTKIFFSGDHILGDITPNITLWSENHDPLRQYLESLDKVKDYDISLVLPGHRNLLHHHRQRIAELRKHHEVRAEEVLSILEKGEQNAYQVASQMTWDIDCDVWEDFPLPQKWFAAGETLAHLQYLQGQGRVKRELREEKAWFSLADVRFPPSFSTR
jgi:glyoxylase-like metal-dependent hydrolase (beta-lactamase superfamily II)